MVSTAYSVWLTPQGLRHCADATGRQDLISEVEPALNEYLAVACRPLLAVPPADRSTLAAHVDRFVVAGFQHRANVLLALYRALGNDIERLLSLSSLVQEYVPEIRSRGSGLFAKNFVDCFEMGARVYVQTVQRLMERTKDKDAKPQTDGATPEQLLEWIYAGNCLDLCATTIALYLEEDGDPARSEIPEEICFLLKEYALSHGALAQIIFPLRGRERPAVGAGLNPDDKRWDHDFCSLALPDLRANLSRL